ncbi:MAG: carboxypeptidase-like regulatory domain-containing protein, partial [Bacteroidales bacterium]|nr:carboxypeptidase-like regulatory domain-containing protein [Bacteroidales bacterium]
MRNFTKYLLTVVIALLSSTVMLAQLTVSSYSSKAPVLPDSRAVLYEQTNSGGGTRASQDFETVYDAYDCQGADDFYVPTGLLWNIQTVTATGTQSNTSANITVVHVFFFADAGGVPATTAIHSLYNLTCVDSPVGVLTIPLPGGVALGPGHYWVSVQDAAPYSTYGQWYWALTTSIYNSQCVWRNPGNGFGTGATTWTNLTALGYPNTDYVFRLEGSSGPIPTCEYRIDLWDAYGDGWNGGYLDVFVDGSLVLDNITLSYGSGPAVYYFTVPTGGSITTTFYAGGWPYECYYYIYDYEGTQVWFSYNYPYGSPPDVLPGQLYGACPQEGAVEGYVFNYDGLAISGATIQAEGVPPTTSGADGYYFLDGVNAGATALACSKPGYNVAVDVVSIVAGETAYHEFHLTQPNMVVNPLLIQETLNPNEFYTTSLNVLNNGNGPLDWQATVNLLTAPILPCEYSISLYDTFGDGWNGGSLDVLLNGVVVLDNITLASGLGPVTFYFTVISG